MDMQCGKCLKSIDLTEANWCEVHQQYYCDLCYCKNHEAHNEYSEVDPEFVLLTTEGQRKRQ